MVKLNRFSNACLEGSLCPSFAVHRARSGEARKKGSHTYACDKTLVLFRDYKFYQQTRARTMPVSIFLA
jgi:hypothetical protein